MLQLQNITKIYAPGSNAVTALNGVSLTFRRNEFVSILGQSGCGKTTLLNIVGGLDRYTSGDLIINGQSTKTFGDRQWDTYRNHTIGFVFQSYNLIPHQTVLQNVELALTLSGVGKAERRRRAKEALEMVGLGDQLKKRPGEMSGGQMQRVAIARALVNDPDIILADEPTGALDTETSVQVMNILAQVARDRLVVMVTHNPELAETYSTRIIRMLDGRVIDDSAPLTEEELAAETDAARQRTAENAKRKQPSMSAFTSFGLSLKNLFTKKGRTLLTSFAGSIGIIGIALIYAVSNGMTAYIDTVQEDTLASYPLTLEATHMDVTSLLTSFIGAAQSGHDHDKDAVYQKAVIYDLVNALSNTQTNENDLKSFKTYLESARNDKADTTGLRESVSGVQYAYGIQPLIYTKSVDGDIIVSDSAKLMQELIADYMGSSMAETTGSSGAMSGMMPMGGMATGMWQELPPGNDNKIITPLLEKQYDLIHGSWPKAYNEVVLVVDENNELDDMTLYALGLSSKETVDAIMDAAMNQKELEMSKKSWSYKEICGMEFRTVFAADCYVKDDKSGLYTDLRDTEAGLKYLYDNGEKLKVSGIIRPSEEASASMLTGSIGYTHLLTRHVIEQSNGSEAVKAQLADDTVDVLTGLPFEENTDNLTDKEKETAFTAYVKKQDAAGRAALYTAIQSIPPAEYLKDTAAAAMKGVTRDTMEQTLVQGLSQQMNMNADTVKSYLAGMDDEELTAMYRQAVEQRITAQYAAEVTAQLAPLGEAGLAAAMDKALTDYTAAQCAAYYDEVLTFSDASYEENLKKLGSVDLDSPTAINLYAATFAGKDVMEEAIADYNDNVEELSRITYTDYVGLMMSSVTTIIDAITYVLIAFVSISLVVSSIMIGVITLISVQERTKEIGILRAIGASKRDVSGLFNAETVIIGFSAGLLGVLVTYLLCLPINAIIHALTGLQNLSAFLPPTVGGVLIVISVLLTMLSGIIPSRSAAKKDPVVALRTE